MRVLQLFKRMSVLAVALVGCLSGTSAQDDIARGHRCW